MRAWIAGLALLLVTPAAPAETGSAGYCDDKETAQKWRELAEKHPDDNAIQRLHALRLGLCKKIRAGEISVQQGGGYLRATAAAGRRIPEVTLLSSYALLTTRRRVCAQEPHQSRRIASTFSMACTSSRSSHGLATKCSMVPSLNPAVTFSKSR